MELITLKPLVVPLFCLGAGHSGYKLHRPLVIGFEVYNY